MALSATTAMTNHENAGRRSRRGGSEGGAMRPPYYVPVVRLLPPSREALRRRVLLLERVARAGLVEERLDFFRFERFLRQQFFGEEPHGLAVFLDDDASAIVAGHHDAANL